MFDALLLQVFVRLVNAAAIQKHSLATAAKEPFYVVPKQKTKPQGKNIELDGITNRNYIIISTNLYIYTCKKCISDNQTIYKLEVAKNHLKQHTYCVCACLITLHRQATYSQGNLEYGRALPFQQHIQITASHDYTLMIRCLPSGQ